MCRNKEENILLNNSEKLRLKQGNKTTDKKGRVLNWCRWWDSNPHSNWNCVLNTARLPISPHRLLISFLIYFYLVIFQI